MMVFFVLACQLHVRRRDCSARNQFLALAAHWRTCWRSPTTLLPFIIFKVGAGIQLSGMINWQTIVAR